MPRLRTVRTSDPGWRRLRHGRGHRYLDQYGRPLDKAAVERIKALAIPPAWRDVWIAPYPNAHLLAVGVDDAGRKQYLYHPVWRAKRDAAKFDRVLEMATKLPDVRRRLREDLADGALTRRAALSAAVRLVDLGCFRMGSDTYTEQNGSYGLTTLERRHVSRSGEARVFSFVGKSGVEHDIRVTDPQVCRMLDLMTRRRPPEERVLCVRQGRATVPLLPADINEHIRDLFGLEVTAKDFRTWHATVHVAQALGSRPPATTRTGQKRAVKAAVEGAAQLLGNTPTVCRSSYVDPRVVDLYESGTTIAPALADMPPDPEAARDHLDLAVVALLAD